MTAAERRAAERRRLLGDAVIEHIHAEVAKAPPPTPDVLDLLRPILTRPAGRRPLADSGDRAA